MHIEGAQMSEKEFIPFWYVRVPGIEEGSRPMDLELPVDHLEFLKGLALPQAKMLSSWFTVTNNQRKHFEEAIKLSSVGRDLQKFQTNREAVGRRDYRAAFAMCPLLPASIGICLSLRFGLTIAIVLFSLAEDVRESDETIIKALPFSASWNLNAVLDKVEKGKESQTALMVMMFPTGISCFPYEIFGRRDLKDEAEMVLPPTVFEVKGIFGPKTFTRRHPRRIEKENSPVKIKVIYANAKAYPTHDQIAKSLRFLN